VTLAEFLERVVRPNMMEFQFDGDERAAFNAIAAVDALAAHFFMWCKQRAHPLAAGCRDDTDFRETLARRDANFEIFRDVAKAQKHVDLTRGTPTVKSADQIALGFFASLGEVAFGDSDTRVLIQTNKGHIVEGRLVVGLALDFLVREMRQAGAV